MTTRNETADTPAAQMDAKQWSRTLSAYREPDELRSVIEILITLVPFFSLWTLAAFLAPTRPLLAVIVSVLIGFFLMRVFCIQHDCGHYSLFKRRWHNEYLGRMLSLFTLTPFAVWQRMHDEHHANSGNLDYRDLGEVKTLTVDEYLSLSTFRKAWYRAYRHPVFLFGAAPFLLFFLQYRFPLGLTKQWKYWKSTLLLNGCLATWMFALMTVAGWHGIAFVFLPSTLIGATAGVFTFYIQHQFENSHWDRSPYWNVHNAALLGSSYIVLPRWLAWFTADISIHHVHHLYARIPFYRLKEIIVEHPALAEVNRITFSDCFKSVHFHLWDEQQGKMVSFRKLHGSVGGRNGDL